jgi:hypothetical protein
MTKDLELRVFFPLVDKRVCGAKPDTTLELKRARKEATLNFIVRWIKLKTIVALYGVIHKSS